MNGAMQKALAIHAELTSAFLATAAAVPESKWYEARAEGKWAPAEIAAHVVTTHEVVIRELRGGPGMAIVTPRWLQIILGMTYGLRIVYFGKFPKGVRAPRETRPPAPLAKSDALEQFRARVAELDAAAREAAPGRLLSHAFFGLGPAPRGVIICARHVEHHRRQMV